MAKDGNGRLRTIYTILGIIVIVGGAMGWLFSLQGGVKAANKGLETYAIQDQKDNAQLKTDGCDPAQEHTTEIAVIQKSLETLEKGQDKILQAIEATK